MLAVRRAALLPCCPLESLFKGTARGEDTRIALVHLVVGTHIAIDALESVKRAAGGKGLRGALQRIRAIAQRVAQ